MKKPQPFLLCVSQGATFGAIVSRLILLSVAAVLLWLGAGTACAASSAPPLMAHPAWQRLDAISVDFPFAWGKRYFELKSIAEDTDGYSVRLPSQLQRLSEVTKAAQKDVVFLLLDLVPASANVQETSFILRMLQGWKWQLEGPLQRTAATAAGIEHYLEVLVAIGQAVDEMQISGQKKPVMEKASQDFSALYTLVLRQVQQLHTEMNAVRSVTLGLYHQIETVSIDAEKHLPQKWFAYYTTPLMVPSRAFLRLGTNFEDMCKDWLSDEYYTTSLTFALAFNFAMLVCLLLAHGLAGRMSQGAPPASSKQSFLQRLCSLYHTLDIWHKVTFAFCTMVMLNTIVHTLPMLHKGIPYLYMQQVIMVVALAVWARTSPTAPKVWELAFAPVTGLLFLHGDAGSLLTLLGAGGSIVLTLTSMLHHSLSTREKTTRSSDTKQSALTICWTAALLASLLLTIMGFGRLTTPLLMLILVISAVTAMLKMINSSAKLMPYTTVRVWFVPLFAMFLCTMSISFLVACPGFDTLRNYWNANAIPFMGINITFGRLILTIFSFLGALFVSKISKQILKNFARSSHALDASAVPVLHVVIDAFLFTIFATFVMSTMGLDVTSLAFIGGGVSIGLGFAAKTILSNFFCGLVIIFSKAVRAGDQVEVGGNSGRVLSVNMRATVLETLKNGIMLVPNEVMLQSNLINWSLNNLHVLEDINVRVASSSNMENTLAALTKAAAKVEGVLTEPAPQALFVGFGDDSMNFVLKAWIRDVRIKNTTLSQVHIALRESLAEYGVTQSALVTKHLSIQMDEHKQD